MNDRTTSPFELPDDLQKLESSLAQLQPSEIQPTSAEMLFAAGLAAGVKRQTNVPPNRSLLRWSSFAAGIGTGIMTALIATRLLSPSIDSIVDSHHVVDHDGHAASLDQSPVEDVTTDPTAVVSEDAIVNMGSNEASLSAEVYSELPWSELSLAEQQIWGRVGRNDLEGESIDVPVRPVNFNYLTAHELRKLAAEIL